MKDFSFGVKTLSQSKTLCTPKRSDSSCAKEKTIDTKI